MQYFAIFIIALGLALVAKKSIGSAAGSAYDPNLNELAGASGWLPGNPHTFDHLFIRYSQYPSIAKAVCKVESAFNPNAVGDNGNAHGLMQIWLPTAKGYGFAGSSADLMKPETNVKFACRFLDDMIQKYGREKGIMAYNLGETKLRKGYTVPGYLAKVEGSIAV